MNNVSGHIAMLVGAGMAAYALAALVHAGKRTQTASSAQVPVVVVPPRRAAEPEPASPASAPPRSSATPGGRATLARQLQIELKRAGCYAGEINGVWTPSTRRAMKAFTDGVNATLPIDKPDYILLALVQGHRHHVCGPVETPASPIVATMPTLLVPPTPVTAPPKAEASPRPPAPRVEPTSGAPQAQPPVEPSPPSARPRRSARHSGPVPAVGVRERRARRSHRPSPQLRYARSLLRSLQRAAMTPLRLP